MKKPNLKTSRFLYSPLKSFKFLYSPLESFKGVYRKLTANKKKVLIFLLLLLLPLLTFILITILKKPGKLPSVVGTYKVNTNIVKTDREHFVYQSRTDGFEVFLQDRFSEKPKIRLETDSLHFIEFDLSSIVGNKPKVKKNKINWEKGNIEVEQIILADRIKENIILKQKPSTNEFKIGLNKSDNLIIEKVNDKFNVLDKDSEKLLMSLSPLYITDDNDSEGSGEMIINDTEVIIKIDQNFLNTASYPITIDPTVITAVSISNPTGMSSQRKTFFANDYYWVFYSDGTNMVYRTSSDGTSWSGTTTVDTATVGSEFAVWLDGTTFYYAREDGSYDIAANRGTISGTSISWDGETTVLNGSGSTDDYAEDAVNIVTDSSGYIWVTSNYYNGSSRTAVAVRSTNTDDVSAWESADTLDTASAYLRSTSIVALPSNQVYVIWYDHSGGGDPSYWKGKLYNGSSWDGSATTIEEAGNYTGYTETTPAMVVDNDNVLHVVLADEEPAAAAQNQVYLNLSPPYSSSDWSERIDLTDSYAYDNIGHGLTLNSSDNTLTLFESRYIHCGGTVRSNRFRRYENGWMPYYHFGSNTTKQDGGTKIDPSHRRLDGLFVYDADAGGPFEDDLDDTIDCTGSDLAHSTSGRMLDANTSDYVYIGLTEPFQTLAFHSMTVATGTPTMVVEYSQGSGSWAALTNGSHGLVDNTSGFTVNNPEIRWTTNPSDWVPDSVNGSNNMYWVRLSYSVTPITGPVGGEISTMRQASYMNSNYSDPEKAFMIWADSHTNSGTYNINFYSLTNLTHDQRLSYGNDTNPGNLNFQRSSFYQNGTYFTFFQDNEMGGGHPNNIYYKTSSDGVTWSGPPTEVVDADRHDWSDNFAVALNGNRVYLAYQYTDYDIVVKAGTITGATITWDTTNSGVCTSGACTVFNGTSGSDDYAIPNIAVDSSGKIWVMARYYDGANYNLRAIRSTYPNDLTSWESATQLGDANDDAYLSAGHIAGSMVPLENDKMYAIWYADGEQRGQLFNGFSWDASTLTTIASTSLTAGTESYTPTAVVDNDNTIHVVYPDSNAYLQHKICTYPFGSSDWSTATAVDGSLANKSPSLSLNTVDNSLTLFYTRQWAYDAYQAAYKRYTSTDGWDSSPSYMGNSWEESFDAVFVYDDSAGTYVDETSDAVDQSSADIAHTTSSSILEERDDYIYLGMDQKFDSIVPVLSTAASSDGAITLEYSQGSSSWNTLPRRDGTNNLVNSERPIMFDIPIDWETDTVNSTSGLYWVRIGWATAPTTAPVGSTISPVMYDEEISANYSSKDKTFATWMERDIFYGSPYDSMKKVNFYSPPIVDEPIHYHFNEGHGTTGNDASGFRDNASITNAVWKTENECVSGNCLYFDGTGDYASKTDNRNADFQSDDSFTLEAWIRHGSSTPSTQATIISKYEDTHYDGGYKLYLNSSGYACLGIDDDTASFPEDSACGSDNLADSKWHHIAGVKNGTTSLTLYVDGVQVATDTSISSDNSLENNDDLYIGIDADGSSYGFSGYIDEVKIHREARTQSQINTDFIKGASTDGSAAVYGDDKSWITDGLVGYWDMEEASGSATVDRSGNSNNGTLTNMQETGWADSGGSTTTLIDTDGSLSSTDDVYNSMIVEITDGSCGISSGTQRTISDYTGASNTIEVGTAWGSAPDGCGYIIKHQGTGKFGNGLGFSGNGDNVVAALPTGLVDTGTSSFTVTAWTKQRAANGSDPLIAAKPGYFGGLVIPSAGFTYGARCDLVNTNDDTYFALFDSASADTWYHYVCIYDSSSQKLKLYVNGELEDEEDFSGTVRNYPDSFYIGEDSENDIDEVRVYNRALSPGEVQKLYNWAPGPVAHWKLDEVSDGSSAVTRYDSSGNGNNLTDNNTTPSKPGKFGNSADFTYTNTEYLEITDGNQNGLDITGPITVEGWFSMDYNSVGSNIVTKQTNNDRSYSLGLSDSGTGGNPRFGISSDGSSYDYDVSSSGYISNDGTWHHYAGVYDGSYVYLYVDGVSVGTPDAYSGAINNSAGPFRIGAGDTYQYPPDGRIDDVRVYNYARTQEQIIQDMNAGHPAPGSPVGSPVLYYKFDEGYGDTAYDSSPQGNNGDLAGSGTTCPQSGDSACPSWTNSGKYGKALDFDGTDDYVKDDITDFTGEVSVSLWTKMSSTGQAEWTGIFSSSDNGSLDNSFQIDLDGSNNYRLEEGASNDLSFGAASTTEFTHLAVTIDSVEGLKMYMNGKPVNSDATETSGDIDVFKLGVNRGDSLFYDGIIDEVKIYNFALTADQVKIEYNQGKAAVFGATSSDTSGTGSWDAASEYCPPGSTDSCTAPVAEWKMDENTDTSLYDTSENNYTGTLGTGNSAPEWTTGKIGPGLLFDGINDYVNIGDYFKTGADRTIAAWIYLDDVTHDGGIITKSDNPTAEGMWLLFFDDQVSVNSNSPDKISYVYRTTGAASGWPWVHSSTLTTGQWYHVEVVHDWGSDIDLYINGILDNAYTQNLTTTTSTESSDDVIVGDTTDFSKPFEGKIDQIRIYDYARTPAQIAWEYNQGKPVGHWRLDECQGVVAYDSADPAGGGTRNNGTITIGGTGDNEEAGTCSSGDTTDAWYNGRTGKRNASLDFDGADDHFQITDTANLRFDASTQDFALFAWVKRDANGEMNIVSKEDADNDGWRLQFNSSNQALCSVDAIDVTSSSAITDTSWHQVGCVIDRDGNGQVYLDGKANGSATAISSEAMATTANIRVGTRAYTSTNYFDGQIDDVKIFNYALTDQQILTEYNSGSVRFGGN